MYNDNVSDPSEGEEIHTCFSATESGDIPRVTMNECLTVNAGGVGKICRCDSDLCTKQMINPDASKGSKNRVGRISPNLISTLFLVTLLFTPIHNTVDSG